jgi:VIT1/CCC1 family predicted Fe2+/Mn2+ transporter
LITAPLSAGSQQLDRLNDLSQRARRTTLVPSVAAVSLTFLLALGSVAAHAMSASIAKGNARGVLLGALAMGLTYAVGAVFGSIA